MVYIYCYNILFHLDSQVLIICIKRNEEDNGKDGGFIYRKICNMMDYLQST